MSLTFCFIIIKLSLFSQSAFAYPFYFSDDDEDNDFEEGYKYSHSSSYKKGDHGDSGNDAHSNGGSDESNDSGYGESESYRRSYREDDSGSEESEDEDNENGESRNAGEIIYGGHPNGQIIVKHPSSSSTSPKSKLKSSSPPTHHQYMIFGNSNTANTPNKKYSKKQSKHTSVALSPSSVSSNRNRKHDHPETTSTLMHENLKGYSSYVVHKAPPSRDNRDTNVGHALSSSLVNVGTSIQVAGNGNYNEAQAGAADLHGYPDLKPKTAGGYMKTNYRPSGENEDDYDEGYDNKNTRPKYVYEKDAEY